MKGHIVLNVMLTLLLLALVGLHWLVLPDPSRRNWEIFPDMVDSVARDTQAPVPALADGTVIDLRPPTGTIVRGFLPLSYEPTPEDARRAGEELINPWAADDAAAVERGGFIFTNFCAVCHGAAGNGDGPAARRGVPPPPSLHAENALQMSDGQMFHVISLGQKNMAGYATQVVREDRWKVILYIRKLQQEPETQVSAAADGDAPPSPEVQ